MRFLLILKTLKFRCKNIIFISLIFFNLNSYAFIDTWKILKNSEDMIEILDTAQDVGELLEEETPMIDQSRSEINGMMGDLKEIGYTQDEIREVMSPYEWGQNINRESIRKLNQQVKRIKSLNKKIVLASGLKGTPEGITARESIASNLTLQNIHNELVMDRVLREQKETLNKRLELKEQIKNEKELKLEMELANKDSIKTLGFAFSPFKMTKLKEAN
jgi:hypothetical protein